VVDIEKASWDLAALLYYQHPKKKDDDSIESFEESPEGSRKSCYMRAKNMINLISKLNLTLAVPQDPKKVEEQRNHGVDLLTDLINKFNESVKHPKNVKNMYPSRELAHKICEWLEI
jgi:hypothetical protein